MSFPSTTARVAYSGDGSTVEFSVTFPFQANADLAVVLTTAGVDTTQTLNTHYVVGGAGQDSGGTVRFTTAPAVGTTVTIFRDVDLNQERSFTYNGAFPATTVTLAVDKAMQAAQQLNEKLKRTFRLPETAAEIAPLSVAERAGKITGFDAEGDPTLYEPTLEVFTNGPAYEVTNIAALKALSVATMPTGKQVVVAGYYAAGDGGGGVFYYSPSSSSTDDAGSIIAPNAGSGRWIRVFKGAVDPRLFGAKLDGITPDQSAIQSAINYLSDMGGGILKFPACDCSVVGGINVAAGITISGAGYSTNIVITGAESGVALSGSNIRLELLRLSGSVSRMIFTNTAISQIRIYRVNISGATVNPSVLTVAGIYIDNVNDLEVSECSISACGQASSPRGGAIVVNSGTSSFSSDVRIVNTRIDCGNCAFGVLLFNCNSALVTGCNIVGAQLDATGSSGYGIAFYGKDAVTHGNTAISNLISDCAGSGIYTADSQQSILSLNTINDCAQSQTDGSLPVGLIALNNGAGSLASSNVLINSGKNGISIVGDDIILSGNRISDCGSNNGIQLRGNCNGVTVESNIIDTCYVGVYTASNATKCSFSNNVSNATYHTFLATANSCDLSKNRGSILTNGIVVSAGADNNISLNNLSGFGSNPGVSLSCNTSIVSLNRCKSFASAVSDSGSGNTVLNNI